MHQKAVGLPIAKYKLVRPAYSVVHAALETSKVGVYSSQMAPLGVLQRFQGGEGVHSLCVSRRTHPLSNKRFNIVHINFELV